jgi:CMP-N-acetylneuraminic acid synthetase
MKLIAMIPARIGSERLKQKNLRLLGGVPIVAHAVQKAKASQLFDRVVLNGDDPVFGGIASQYDCEFYLRPKELGSSETRSDDVVYDFMTKHSGDAVAWVNSASPLMTVEDVVQSVNHFKTQNLDSLITSQNLYRHALIDNAPINFSTREQFARTQDLTPVSLFNYCMMIWRTKVFCEDYQSKGYAMLCGKFGTYVTSELSSVLLKNATDLALIEALYAQTNTKP